MAQDTKTKAVVEEAVPEKRPRKEPPPPRYAPNIIPLIDVLFMLLLYFLLSTRFRQMEGDIQGSLPGSQGSEPATVRPEEVYIKVRPVGEDHMKAIYEVTGKNLALESADSLYQALERFQKEFSPDAPVLIEPTGDVRWAFVVEAFNQSVRAKFKNIGFVAN